MISKPRLGRITQGTIFCAAKAEDYSGRPVWGVVITARCDTAHEKTPQVNYLPLVTIEDWLLGHGGLISLDKDEAEVLNKFKSLLKKRGLEESLLLVHDVDTIVNTHFSNTSDSQSENSKQAKEFLKDCEVAGLLANRLDVLRKCLLHPLPNGFGIKAALPDARKSVESVVKDLVTHKLAGYYFIPSIGSLSEKVSDNGYVVLLREIHHVSRRGVIALTEGVSSDSDPKNHSNLCFDCFDFALPVAELTSPWTEHLLQSFCNLFGRIGIADADKRIVAKIVDATYQPAKD